MDRWLHEPARDTSFRGALYGPSRSRPTDRPAEGTARCRPYCGGDRPAAQCRGLPLTAARALFNAATVRSMLSRQGLTRRPHRDAAIDAGFHKSNEWWLEELALELKMPSATLLGWCRKGWVHVRKVTLAYRRFIIRADAKELDRLRRLQKYQRRGLHVPYPSELTTPMPRTDR